MAVQGDPIPNPPQHDPVVDPGLAKRNPSKQSQQGQPEQSGGGGGDKSTGRFARSWMAWFLLIREKINVINALLVNLSKVTGQGFLVLVNGQWFTRVMQGPMSVQIQNADGAAGDPTFILENDEVSPGNMESYGTNAAGTKGWFKPALFESTGILDGGTLSLGGGNTFNIAQLAVGWTDYDTNPVQPTRDVKVLGPFVGLSVPSLAVLATYVGIFMPSGTVIQQSSPFSATQQRDIAPLGVIVSDGVNLITVNNLPSVLRAGINQVQDLIAAIGPMNISGNRITPNGANLLINKSAGKIFKQGSNFANNEDDPHGLTLPALTGPTFAYRLSNGTQFANRTTIDPDNYESPLGTLANIPASNRFTIQRISIFTSNIIRIQYGQFFYNSISEAEGALATEAFVTEQNIAENGILLAFLIVQDGTTNLTVAGNAKFIPASKFGGPVGSGGSTLTNTDSLPEGAVNLYFTDERAQDAVGTILVDSATVDFTYNDVANTITASVVGGVFPPEAPVDGFTYGRKNAAWVEVVPNPKGPPATLRMINYFTNLLTRFSHGLNDTPESGANAGSDFELRSFNDAGALIGTAIRVNRATRETTLFADGYIEKSLAPTLWLNSTGNALNQKKVNFSVDSVGHAYIQTSNDIGTTKTYVQFPTSGGIAAGFTGNPFWQITPTRFIADFSAGSPPARMTFQTNQTDNVTVVSAMPNGTSTVSLWAAINSSDSNNAGQFQHRMNATLAILNSTATGTAIIRDMAFQFNDVTKATLSTTGNFNAVGGISADGNVVAGASMFATTFFVSVNNAVVLATNVNPGTVFLRPNGPGVVAGQAMLTTSGSWQVPFASIGTTGTLGVFNVGGGRAIFGGNNENYTIGIGYNNTRAQAAETVFIGATDSANPNMIFSDASGALMATMAATSGNFQAQGSVNSVTGVFKSTSTLVYLATTGAGALVFRPNGEASGLAQLLLNSDGQLWSDSKLSIGPSHNNQGFQYAWNTIVPGAGNNEYINNFGGGTGGHVWYTRSTPSNSPVGVMSVSGTTGNLSVLGSVTAVSFIPTSDERLKKGIKNRKARERLPDLLRFVEFIWKSTDKPGLGLLAQDLLKVAPEYVHEGEDGILGIDKMGLALECVIGLAARVRELEERLDERTN